MDVITMTPEAGDRGPLLPGWSECEAGHRWDDTKPTGCTPVPAGRCPFERLHEEDEDMPEIERTMVVSTSHLPARLGLGGLTDLSVISADELDHGFMVYVGLEPAWSAPDPADADPDEREDTAIVCAVLDVARRHGCKWVRYDTDAPTLDGLPTWEW